MVGDSARIAADGGSSAARAVVVVLDAVGCGALPDAGDYGDEGSNTLGNTARAVGGLHLPNLQRLGLGNLTEIEGVPPTERPAASFGKAAERSRGKDTTTGHWEMMGLIHTDPFPTYPDGFPPEIIEPFEEATGRTVLGNKPASGTVIIEGLGAEHLRTGSPIVYTSADSVFQIAAHEEVVSTAELYSMCEVARELLLGRHAVARVIARPFVGEPGSFARTANRRDYSLTPPRATQLDMLCLQGLGVLGIGKIGEIFANRGVSRSIHTESNAQGIEELLAALSDAAERLVFANLVDFDSEYGHRNNPEGFAEALIELDRAVPDLLSALPPADLLIVTADHGCDPTTPSTDHSREYIPILMIAPGHPPCNLGTRDTFADLGATVASFLNAPSIAGCSMLQASRSAAEQASAEQRRTP